MMPHWPCKEGHYLQNHSIPIKIRTLSQTLFVFYHFVIFEAQVHELQFGFVVSSRSDTSYNLRGGNTTDVLRASYQ